MSTIRVGSYSAEPFATADLQFEPWTIDSVELLLLALLGLAFLRCFYARICKSTRPQKDKQS